MQFEHTDKLFLWIFFIEPLVLEYSD